MLITLCKIGEVHFRLLGTNGFHAKVKIERFTAAGSRCPQNFQYENFTSSLGRLCQKLHQKACRTCSTIIFPHSTNQIIHSWSCRCRCCRHFLNSSVFQRRRFVISLFLRRIRKPGGADQGFLEGARQFYGNNSVNVKFVTKVLYID